MLSFFQRIFLALNIHSQNSLAESSTRKSVKEGMLLSTLGLLIDAMESTYRGFCSVTQAEISSVIKSDPKIRQFFSEAEKSAEAKEIGTFENWVEKLQNWIVTFSNLINVS